MTISQMMYYKQQKGYSLDKLSELSGVPKGTIQKIFSGETKSPRYETLKALEEVLKPNGITYDYEPAGASRSPIDVQLDCDNRTMVQPDVLILCDRSKLLRRCIMGAPDFIIEILSPSTKRKDAHLKLHKYRDAGVREYWLVDLEKERVLVYFFEQDELPTIYGADMEIPVGIFGGELKLVMADMFDLLRQIK